MDVIVGVSEANMRFVRESEVKGVLPDRHTSVKVLSASTREELDGKAFGQPNAACPKHSHYRRNKSLSAAGDQACNDEEYHAYNAK